MIFYSNCIQFFIINTEMKSLFRFLCKQNWKNSIKATDLNKFFDQIFIKIMTEFLNLIMIHAVQKHRWKLKFFFQLNNKITNLMWEQNVSFFFEKTLLNSFNNFLMTESSWMSFRQESFWFVNDLFCLSTFLIWSHQYMILSFWINCIKISSSSIIT